jgi:hypothetical protein
MGAAQPRAESESKIEHGRERNYDCVDTMECEEMRCISPEDGPDLIGPSGFTVSLAHQGYRIALALDRRIGGLQARVGARPPNDPSRLRSFLEAANRWLPSENGMTGSGPLELNADDR